MEGLVLLTCPVQLVTPGWQRSQTSSSTAQVCRCPLLGNGAPSSTGKLHTRTRFSPRDTHVLQLDNPINTGLAPRILAAGITSILLLNSP